MGHLPRGPRRLLGPEPPAGRPGHRRGPLRERDRPGGHPATTRATTPTSSSPPTRASAPTRTVETLANLKPAFKPEDGKVTAGNSSQITDGASAVLIMSEEKANALGLTPRARFHAFALAGVDPITMLTGPIPATTNGARAGQADHRRHRPVEINEAFASVVLAWEKEHHPDMEQGQPQRRRHRPRPPARAPRAAKLMATLLNELERTDGRYGLLTMCEGGGLANATIIERLG